MSIYTWRRKYLKYGMVGLMAKRKSIPRAPLPQEHALSETEELEKLRTQLQELQFEVDVMKETIAVLKKDPGVDLTVLRNREKAVIIDALKGKYALPTLLSRFNGSVSAIVPMSVINTRGFDLPQTGENGTWLFAVGGVLIVSLSAAFIFFILAKKRKTDEQ